MKSPPELWEELSEVERLAAHLGEFGEIRITRLEPEQRVSWEGEHASGTVEIEPSGWGTRVTLTAELAKAGGDVDPEPDAGEPAPEAEPEPEQETAAEPPGTPESAPIRGFWARLFGSRRAEPEPVVARPEPVVTPDPVAVSTEPEPPEPEADADPEPPPAALDSERVQAVLEGTLNALGAAHHRPFSRS